jgi:chromosome segregation ATPase
LPSNVSGPEYRSGVGSFTFAKERLMGDDIRELRNRQDRLEERVGELESTAKAEAIARAGMDEDLEELKIKRGMLQKVLDTQSEHNTQLQELTSKVNNVELVLGYVYGTGEELKGRMSGVETRLTGVETRLTGVETTLADVKGGVDEVLARLGTSPGNEH